MLSINPCRAAAALSTKSWTASHALTSCAFVAPSGSESEGTRHVLSPGRPSGSRLVASMRTCSPVRSNTDTASAHARTRCSQLSRIISVFVSLSVRTSASSLASPCSSLTSTTSAMPSRTSDGSLSGDRSTKRTPSGNCSSRSAPTWIASRVFPHPPEPINVTTR